ncbi:MAG TPA: cell division protein FtsL [Syntrophus sp. (in: bacteria)]|jgi:cell division protein FtsL|nr:cell division protein FtsL [Syntrophus sp. (in: bacteria)]
MAVSDALKGNVQEERKKTGEIKYSVYIVAALALMSVLLCYVASHLQMTKLEYQIAEEISRKERMMDEQKKLKVEIATLKSPQRIAAIAMEKLQMTHPEKEQVVIIK